MSGAAGDRLMAAAVVLEQQAEREAKRADQYESQALGAAVVDDAGRVYALLAILAELRAFRLEARAGVVSNTAVALRREARARGELDG